MKKYLKLFPVALAAFAMASCADDLWDGQSAEQILSDPNNMLVTVEELDEQGPITRSAFGETKITSGTNEGKTYRQFIWTSGDQFKVYDQTNWRIEYWKLNGTANTAMAKDNTAVEGTIFSLDTDATDENNVIESKDRAYAIFPSVVKTAPITDADLEAKFGEFNENRTEMKVILPSEIVVNADVVKENSGASYGEDAGFAYTCQAPMWGYSLGSTDGNKLTFQYLTSFVRVSLTGLGAGTKYLKVTAPNGKCINGTFAIKDFDYAGYGTGKVPALVAPTFAPGNNIITVKVTTTKAVSENVIFIPVPVQDYEGALTVKICDTNSDVPGDWEDVDEIIATGAVAVTNYKRGKFVKFGKESAEEVEVKSLAELNQVIRDYADFGRNVTVTVKPVDGDGNASDLLVRDGADFNPLAKKISLPALKNNIILNFEGAGIRLAEAVNLTIEDASSTVGTGKLTINIPENEDGTDADVLADYTLPAIAVKSAQAIEFGYIPDADDDTKIPVFGALTVNNAAAKVTANGAYGANTITVTSATEFAIGAGYTGTGNVVNNGAATLTLGAAAPVTADVATTLNIKAAQNTIETSATTVNVEANVTKLYLKNTTAKQTVNLKAGTIGTLGGATATTYKFADGQSFEVKSEGVSAITSVNADADEATVTKAFNSKWNADLADDEVAAALTALDAPAANIYTAAQLAKVAGDGDANYVLKTNITAFEKPWTSPDVKCTSFKATGVTVTGLNAPLFGVVKGGAISDVTISGAAIAADDEHNDGAGIFAKQAVGTVSFKNVHVTGTNTITGMYYVGGIVGIVGDGTNVTAVTIGDSENTTAANKVTLANITFSTTATDLGTSGFEFRAGTFGKLVGTVKDAAGKQSTLTIVNGDCAVTGGTFNKTSLLFSNNRRYNDQHVNNGWFKGESDLIGYIDVVNAATSIVYNGKTYIIAGTQVQQGSTTTYDVYYIGAKGGDAELPAIEEDGKTLVRHYLNSYYDASNKLIEHAPAAE